MSRTASPSLHAAVRSVTEAMCPNVPLEMAPKLQKSAQLCPNVPDGAPASQGQNCKTNPPSSLPISAKNRPLSLRQQHAARLLVLGLGSKRAARQLSINHHTIARWKRDPRFIALIDKYTRAFDAGAADMAKTIT